VIGMPLLEVDNLRLYYSTSKGIVKAVDGVSFDLDEGETLALVGESGCGKSTIAKALIRLWERNVSMVSGEVRFEGRDVLHIDAEEFRTQYRWKKNSLGAASLNEFLESRFNHWGANDRAAPDSSWCGQG